MLYCCMVGRVFPHRISRGFFRPVGRHEPMQPALTPLESALTKMGLLSPLESALTKKGVGGGGGRFCPARYCPSVSEPVEPVASRHFLAASSSEKAQASYTDHCEVGPPFGSRVTTQWSPFCHPGNLPTRLDILMGRDSFPSGAWGVYSGSREAHSCNFLVRGF